MVEHLPLDAPAYRAERGHAWRDEHVLMHDISSQLRVLNTNLANLFREKGAPAIEPEFFPSPAAAEGRFSDGDVVDEAETREIRSNMERLWGNPTAPADN